ncbi:O-fucosyltransferase family protein [Pseudoscourfieldia marina]
MVRRIQLHPSSRRASSSSRMLLRNALPIAALLLLVSVLVAIRHTASLMMSTMTRRDLLALSSSSADDDDVVMPSSETGVVEDVDDHAASNNNLRIAVCITGQIARLEVGSKVQNLFQSLDQQTDVLDLFVSLEENTAGTAHYNNKPKYDSVCGVADNHAVYNAFFPWLRKMRNFTENDDDASFLINPNLPRYQKKLKSFTRAQINARTTNNIRQFRHARWCAQAMEERESRHGFHYDGFVRIRDTSIVLKPFRFPAQLLQPSKRVSNTTTLGSRIEPTVALRKCMSWGGYNDKTVVGNRLALDAALRGSLEGYYLSPKVQETRKLWNPEQLLKTVLDEAGVRAILDNDLLPFVDSRCSRDGGTPCLSQSWKDCHVSSPWNWEIRVCDDDEMEGATGKCPWDCPKKKQKPEQQHHDDEKLIKDQEMRAAFLKSPVVAAAYLVTAADARRLGVTAADIFAQRGWLSALTPQMASTIGLTWRALRDMGMTRDQVLASGIPVRKWDTILGGDNELREVYHLTTNTTLLRILRSRAKQLKARKWAAKASQIISREERAEFVSAGADNFTGTTFHEFVSAGDDNFAGDYPNQA